MDTSPEGWIVAKNENIKLHEQFLETMQRHKDVDVEIFPLSPIPLLIHVGTLISDTVPATVYQYDREQEIWVTNKPRDSQQAQVLILDSPLTSKDDSNILVVAVSVSALIDSKDINEVIDVPFDLLEVKIENPEIDKVLYREDLKLIQKYFRKSVETQLQKKRYREIHLFYSGPAGLAVEVGRSINSRMWPDVVLYQYNARSVPRYQKTFKV
ncbi:hypothetical protein D3C81_1261520 [compost metagenome]